MIDYGEANYLKFMLVHQIASAHCFGFQFKMLFALSNDVSYFHSPIST